MTNDEFNQLTEAANLRESDVLRAARMVLVDGVTAYAACQATGVDKGWLSKYLAKFPRSVCPTCGAPRNN